MPAGPDCHKGNPPKLFRNVAAVQCSCSCFEAGCYVCAAQTACCMLLLSVGPAQLWAAAALSQPNGSTYRRAALTTAACLAPHCTQSVS